jgi:WD40 repeat protein
MVRRWTRTDEPLPGQSEPTSLEPRLSLVDQGRKLVLGSDSHTTIIDVKTGREFLNRSDWGTFFAVENPSNKSELLLVKRTGAIRLFNIDQLGWDEGKIDDVSLKLASEAAPMHAVWSKSGTHFYLAYANGDIAKIGIVDRAAKILWHSQMLGNKQSPTSKSIRLKSGEVRVHTDMDLLLKQDGETEELQYAIRTGSTDRRTHHVDVRFPLKTNDVIVVKHSIEPIQGSRWLKFDDAGEMVLTEELHESFTIDSRRIRVIQQLEKTFFVSSKSAQTYALKRGSDSIESFARMTPRAVTGDRSGRVLYSQNKGGTMTKFHLAEDSTSGLKNLNYQLPTAEDIRVSPDGKYLAVLSDGNLNVHDPESGTVYHQLGKAESMAWNPSVDSGLASCSRSNGIVVFDADFKIAKQIPFELKDGETIVGLHFLTETFGLAGISARRHMLIHTRNLESDYANIVALDPLPIVLGNTESQSSHSGVTDVIRQPIRRNSLIAVSPTEGFFATGTDNGTVNVWYCSPTWGGPRELFDLSGHRGAKITSIAFTTEGNTLITADDN